MSKRTGEVTEDYATYAKHLLTAVFVGVILGVIGTLIGVYTNWYGVLGERLGGFMLQYWYFSVPLTVISVGLVYFSIKSKLRQGKTNE